MSTMILKPEHQELVKKLVAAGRFQNESEAMDEAMRRLASEEYASFDIPEWHIDAVREGLADCEAGRLSDATADDIIAIANGERA